MPRTGEDAPAFRAEAFHGGVADAEARLQFAAVLKDAPPVQVLEAAIAGNLKLGKLVYDPATGTNTLPNATGNGDNIVRAAFTTGLRWAFILDGTLALMFGAIKPLGDLVTTLPAGQEYPGRTAGPSFELFYESDYVLPHREAAWAVLVERIRQAADFCEPGVPCAPEISDADYDALRRRYDARFFLAIARAAFRYLERYVTHRATFEILADLRVWFFASIEPLAPSAE